MTDDTKPNFLIIGCGKCGTTTLGNLLNQHPEIFVVSSPKEPNFFSHDRKYAKGWDWYQSLFRNTKGASLVGEKSVSYSSEEFEDRACQRIQKHVPSVRLIYIVRNPLDRVESAYRQIHDVASRRGKYFPHSIEGALKYRPQLYTNALYWQRINKFRSYFPDEQILVLFLEDLKTDPGTVLTKCFNFLGVDSRLPAEGLNKRLNTADEKYYSNWLMRFIINHKSLNSCWIRLPKKARRKAQVIMRNRFEVPLKWEPSAREFVLSQVAEDSRQFLKFYGKPSDFWGPDFTRKEIGFDPGLGDENIEALRTA
ncbi:MAG TPA: sulfotransferase [Thermodesulfobacteriota bacterium]|nr:sulfotransferase [Thermodesulfobacteriota bacterium]